MVKLYQVLVYVNNNGIKTDTSFRTVIISL